MNEAEMLSLSVSGLALLVSFWTLYRTHFYKKTALIGQLLAMNTQSRENPSAMEFECSLSNCGNREILIREIRMNLNPWPAKMLVPEIESGHVPGVIRPGEIRLVKFTVPSKLIYELGGKGVLIEIQIEATSSEGKVYSMQKGLEPCADEKSIPLSWFIPFKLGKEI